MNVLVSTGNRELTVSQLADLGVRRISVGSALANVAWGAFIRAAREIAETGKFEAFANAASFAELNKLFADRIVKHDPAGSADILSASYLVSRILALTLQTG